MSTPIAASTIAQQAFRLMELSPLSSFADDSEQAAAAREQYFPALDMMLESYDWSFARRVAQLPPATLAAPEIADPDLPHTYELPADLLQLRHVYGGTTFEWRVDGRLLRAGQGAAVTIRYTRRPANEKLLPRLFQLAVSHQLALLLAPRFVQTRTKIEALRVSLDDALSGARRADNHTASQARIDGRPAQGDWATEARR